jgi:hypothetical protein
MIIGFVLMLSIVWISLATALYSNFLPYLALLSDVKNYNMAYYGANTAIERSLLVLRYQEAWFEWTGWWNKNLLISDTPLSDQWWFWYYDENNTTLQRTIVSRPDSQFMPGTWKWNTDIYLLSGSSNDWNKLDYRRPQQIPLWVDNTSSAQAYEINTDRAFFDGQDIIFNLQLIPSVREKFDDWDPWSWELADNIDWDWDGIGNDVIVDRWRKWLYDTGSEFSILPRSLVWSDTIIGDIISLSDDESIREDSINILSSSWNTSITFWNNINPLYNNDGSGLKPDTQTSHLMISDDTIATSGISLMTFNDLLLDSSLSSQELNFFLIRPLISRNNSIYPFLQYTINFVWTPATISQPYFTINWKSQVWDYTVQMNVKKSINKNETLWSFTVVF